jgi:hypothetical protein
MAITPLKLYKNDFLLWLILIENRSVEDSSNSQSEDEHR